jgi:hypothetical protein
MNNEQQELLDEVYVNYTKALIGSITFSEREKHFKSNGLEFNSGYPNYIHHTQEEFINKCKTDTEFSERWGLKIEERELSLEERTIIFQNSEHSKHINLIKFKDIGELNKVIPTKLITITYNDTKLESYE